MKTSKQSAVRKRKKISDAQRRSARIKRAAKASEMASEEVDRIVNHR